jgi:ubiquinone/menaquinone biosynthesis C-methylase UbiE
MKDMVVISSEDEIQQAYSGRDNATRYVDRRFVAPLMEMLHKRQVAAVERVLREQQPRRTLEVAPGPGRLTRDVRPAGKLVCLEYNNEMIAAGQTACNSAVQWVQGNAFELSFNQEFDFLYTFRFVRHFHRADRDRLYEQFRRVLKPGGWLVFDAVNAAVSAPLRAARPEDYPVYDKLYCDEAELKAELAAAGFAIVRLCGVQRWFSVQSRVQVLIGPHSRRLCSWIIHGLELLRRGPALEWVVTCRRA